MKKLANTNNVHVEGGVVDYRATWATLPKLEKINLSGKINIFPEMELSSCRHKKPLYFLKIRFSYITRNGTLLHQA